MITLLSRKSASSLALAIALATGSAVVATAVIPADASAQRRDRDRDRDREENAGGGYSDEFLAIYSPIDTALKEGGADINALRPQLASLIPLMTTNDEKFAGGIVMFNSGIQASDQALQLQGMEFMLESGNIPVEEIGRYNFIAYQLSNNAGDYPKARRYLQGAIDYNFTTEGVDAESMQIAMAENFFASEEYADGFAYLQQAIAGRKAQGLTVDEQWYRRGVTVAYENEIVPTVYEFTALWISEFPSSDNWTDAVNLTRNLNDFTANEILDLFRLSRAVGALDGEGDYDYYVEAADPRRLPKEVRDVIVEGRAAGVISDNNLFITESLEIAEGRIQSDLADLPALEADANAADATVRIVVAAAGAFLSYGEYEKAAGFYQRALSMGGADTNEVLTRLGIAQVRLGDYAAARESFARVTGSRQPIAILWSAYADQLEGA